jgi:hypothetical protein
MADPIPIEIDGPYNKPWPLRTKWWLAAAIVAFLSFCMSVFFTAGALLRHFGVI